MQEGENDPSSIQGGSWSAQGLMCSHPHPWDGNPWKNKEKAICPDTISPGSPSALLLPQELGISQCVDIREQQFGIKLHWGGLNHHSKIPCFQLFPIPRCSQSSCCCSRVWLDEESPEIHPNLALQMKTQVEAPPGSRIQVLDPICIPIPQDKEKTLVQGQKSPFSHRKRRIIPTG